MNRTKPGNYKKRRLNIDSHNSLWRLGFLVSIIIFNKENRTKREKKKQNIKPRQKSNEKNTLKCHYYYCHLTIQVKGRKTFLIQKKHKLLERKGLISLIRKCLIQPKTASDSGSDRFQALKSPSCGNTVNCIPNVSRFSNMQRYS